MSGVPSGFKGGISSPHFKILHYKMMGGLFLLWLTYHLIGKREEREASDLQGY